jgi:oxygen-independent coproporphyrinogen-3 oxidase
MSYHLTGAEEKTYVGYASLPLPRHTSYPTVPCWRRDYGPLDFHIDLCRSRQRLQPLSLYVHVPFCEQLCYFCACTKEIMPARQRQQHDPSKALLDGLEIEAARLAARLGWTEVRQVHLGGGSPTFLRPSQLACLWGVLQRHFRILRDAEVSVELDPRTTPLEHLQMLRDLGFNRVSLGIQDFAPKVQRAIHRIQPFSMVQEFVACCRALGFRSINFDLIYGLPFQTLQTMAETIERTIDLSPDRIAFYRLAVISEMFRWQKAFQDTDLPAGLLPLRLNLLALNRFVSAGYEFIGLDHFARPDDGLSEAARNGSLRRTFQGMKTGKGLDIVGLGPSAISQLEDALAQNAKTSTDWRKRIDQGLATECGLHLSSDDRIRREALQQLYGHGLIDGRLLELRFGIVFEEYFAQELERLNELIGAGVVRKEPGILRLTMPLGRLLVRVVAAVFDRYLPADAFRTGLPGDQSSKVGLRRGSGTHCVTRQRFCRTPAHSWHPCHRPGRHRLGGVQAARKDSEETFSCPPLRGALPCRRSLPRSPQNCATNTSRSSAS